MIVPVCLVTLLGLLPLLILPDIPSVAGCLLWLAAGLSCLCSGHYPLRLCGLLCLSVCWGLLSARQALDTYHYLAQQPVEAEAVVIRSDGLLRHDIQLIKVNQKWLFPRVGVQLWRSQLPRTPCAGQRWRLTLNLRPVHGQLNAGGFDLQRFSLSRRVMFSGRVLSGQILNATCSIPSRWQQAVHASLSGISGEGIVMALAFGDRSGVSSEEKLRLGRTGTAHLMAISGMHISLAAGIGWLVGRAVQRFFAVRYIGFRFPLLVGWLTGLCYSWISGMDPPALRAVLALSVYAMLRCSSRSWSSSEVWLVCCSVMLFFDPLMLLSDSFLLSVFAVGVLIFWHQWAPLPASIGRWSWYLRYPVQLLYLQVGIMLLLLPLQIHLFHGISASSVIANLVAVPLVSFILVPLILSGLILYGIPGVSQIIWQMADSTIRGLFWFLSRLPTGWMDVDQRFSLVSSFGWAWVIAWRFAARRYAVLLLSVALWMVVPGIIRGQRENESEWHVTLLDVGHGLAVALERNQKVILYDTGGAWPGGDAALQTIIPWLKWHHFQLEGIIISHEHVDHIGGLRSLALAFPQVPVRSSLGQVGHLSCYHGDNWTWQGLHFEALWPPKNAGLTGNNRSCVVRVSQGERRLLLTGDLEAPAEYALLARERARLHATILQVPHHGSKTSSREAFLRAVSGRFALASTARYNAWHLPAWQVVRRYQKEGYQWLDTGVCGQITFGMDTLKENKACYRTQISPRWYHQWFGVHRDNR